MNSTEYVEIENGLAGMCSDAQGTAKFPVFHSLLPQAGNLYSCGFTGVFKIYTGNTMTAIYKNNLLDSEVEESAHLKVRRV